MNLAARKQNASLCKLNIVVQEKALCIIFLWEQTNKSETPELCV